MNVNKLLSKSTWKGKEVGQAVLLTTIELNRYHPALNPDANLNPKPLFSKEDIRKMVRGLANEHERNIYYRYVALTNAIIGVSWLIEGYIQQAYHGYYKNLSNLIFLYDAIQNWKRAKEYPIIITEEQYQYHCSKVQEELRERKASFKDIILALLSQYTENYPEYWEEDPPKTPKPIKDALEALKQEPVTNELILSQINKYYKLGYKQLPDGRRSDQMSEEEWERAVEEIIIARHKITIDGRPATYEETIKEVERQRAIQRLKRIYETEAPLDREYVEKYLEDAMEEKPNGITWHYYETPPKGLTKWDIIAGKYNMIELYFSVDTEGEVIKLEPGLEKKYFNEFIKDYPKLFTALKEELSRYKGLTKIAETKPASYYKKIITRGELADAGIWYYKNITTPDYYDIMKKVQPQDNPSTGGIAILKEGSYSMSNIDENGLFIDPFKKNLLKEIADINPEKTSETRNILITGLRLVLGYNKLIDICAEIYATPELVYMKKDEEDFKNLLQAYNNISMYIHTDIPGNEKEQRELRKLLKKVYPIIDLEELRPTEEATSQVKDKIANKGVSGIMDLMPDNNIYNYILELTGLDKEGNKWIRRM